MANLITLTDYKEAKGLQGMKDDSQLTILIDSVSQLVKTYCNNDIVDHYSGSGLTEKFNIHYGETFIQLSQCPVVSIRSVHEREGPSETFSSSNELVANTDFYHDTTTDSVYRINSGGNTIPFKSGVATVQVTYNSGYASVPADLKLAVIDLITYYHKDEHKTRQTIAGASLQNQGTTSQRGNVGFPDHIKRVLDLYKNY